VNNELIVANRFGVSVTIYARTASGNAAPLRTLQGPTTGLSSPIGLVVDLVNSELLVGNSGNASITVYARTASGNAAPLRTLQGPATGLSFPQALTVDAVNNELLLANGTSNSVTIYARTASGNTAPLRSLQGPATGLSSPSGLAVDLANSELFVTNISNSISVYTRTASGNAPPLRTLIGAATELNDPLFLAVTNPRPTATVGLNGSAFSTSQTIIYRATLTPGSTPTFVDIYFGALLPDGVTFASLVEISPGVISFILGPFPIPFLANVTLAPLGVPFSYQFAGFEQAGTYFTYAGLAVAGSNPFLPANQLSLAIQPFQFTP